ncbi:MAG: AzlD domain-containing protein [Ruminiclostridium sp.]|nr:AzlD domain-containing protein [Ruminiclostridium sp.]
MEQETILIILGMSLVTYLPRVLPVVILSKMNIPEWFLQWLKYIPVAVLSALLVPGILISEGKLNFSLHNRNLLAAVPCIFIAYKTKNLFITVLSGVLLMLLLNLLPL